MIEPETRYREAKRVTIIGALINIILSITKVVFGVLGHSQALVADGIHSLSDLLTDALVIIGTRYGSQAPDQEHPYGHQRIETAATLLLALVLILVGIGIIYDGGMRIMARDFEMPSLYVIWIAALSVILKEGLYRYTKIIAEKIQSKLVHMNAWHHRSDAASSIVVVIGVTATLLGFRYFDSIAAIIVGLMIIKMGWSQGWSSVSELVDTAVDSQVSDQIQDVISQVPGVIGVHQLRTRSMGDCVLVDIHVLVGAKLSVSEGHHIAENVYHNLITTLKFIADVVVHIDPEDDQKRVSTLQLPQRQQLIPLLEQRWQGLLGSDNIQGIVLHYISGKIYLEIRLPIELMPQASEAVNALITQYRDRLQDMTDITSVEVSFVSFNRDD